MAAFGLSMWGHVNAFVYDHTSKVLGLASSHTGIWVLFGWRAEFYSIEQILWYRTESGEPYSIWLAPLALYKRGPSLCTHYLLKAWARPQLAILTEYEVCVNMCKRSNYVWLCKSTNRNRWTTMVVSLWFSFKDFSQFFPMRDYGVYIEWCTIMMIFVRVFSQWGFWVYISVCNPRRYPEHWYPVLAWGECLMVLLMG